MSFGECCNFRYFFLVSHVNSAHRDELELSLCVCNIYVSLLYSEIINLNMGLTVQF